MTTTQEHLDRIYKAVSFVYDGIADSPARRELMLTVQHFDALREQIAEMERERCPHDEASISAMAADYQEKIAALLEENARLKAEQC